jgi:hypothetical protein
MRTATAGERPFFILGGHEEVDRVVDEWPEARFVPVYDLTLGAAAAGFAERFRIGFEQFMAEREAEHATVYLTAAARRVLDAEPVLAAFVREHLSRRYRLVPVENGVFRSVRIDGPPAADEPRPDSDRVRR